MKSRLLVLSAALLVFGCTAYRQLQPKPEPISDEKGFLELKKGKNDFDLGKKKKYFIQFPSAQDNNFYLVLHMPQKKSFSSFLTDKLVDNKKYGDKIKDESTADTLSVYPIQKNGSGYFLLIDQIGQDIKLHVDYRYAPQWRFKFENKYSDFKETLGKNRVDRKTYNSIGNGNHLEGTDYNQVMNSVKEHSASLQTVYKELLAIESIFPAKIINSDDAAYQNYLDLKKTIEEEMAFQKNYLAVLNFFGKEYGCRGNPAEFVKSVDAFITFFADKNLYTPAIIKESQNVIGGRLTEVVPFYDQRLGGKEDTKPFDAALYLTEPLYKIGTLYQLSGLQTPSEYSSLVSFVREFNSRSSSLKSAQDSLNKINETVQKSAEMPSDDFFKSITSSTEMAQKKIPLPLDETFGKYRSYHCTNNLNDEITKQNTQFEGYITQYRQAESLVPQLNVLKIQKDYSSMLGILKQNITLSFLLDKYRSLDKLSIQEQGNAIELSLRNQSWAPSEHGLSKLFQDQNFLNPAEALPIKAETIGKLEDSLYTEVDRVSRTKIDKFLEDNVNKLDNVDSLYTDSVFMPVYNITFSSGSRSELIQRKNDLISHLAKMKDDEFPAKAIKLLYDQFMANPNDNGILKARAIVTHGNYYKGDDKKIKQRVSECDPYTAKWITKPKEYRRVLVVPVTDNHHGKNKYVVRFNIDIPTEANFPVYDVNIKLPKEIAENAASSQWYESITLNKNPLKNEGRFTITAPSPANDYECQISPVQMSKDQKNILEITFSHNSFKVHAISVMVQKPIIKKN